MTVIVRYFASIRDRVGRGEDRLEASDGLTVAQVWERASRLERPARLLAAVNQEHAGFDHPVRDGDEVAFFPPVTGGGL